MIGIALRRAARSSVRRATHKLFASLHSYLVGERARYQRAHVGVERQPALVRLELGPQGLDQLVRAIHQRLRRARGRRDHRGGRRPHLCAVGERPLCASRRTHGGTQTRLWGL